MFSHILVAADNPFGDKLWLVIGAIALLIIGFFLVIFFSFFRLWIQAVFTGAKVTPVDLIGMKLRNVDYGMIVRQKIALRQAGVKVDNEELEAHYLARGNVPKVAAAVIACIRRGSICPGASPRPSTLRAATSSTPSRRA